MKSALTSLDIRRLATELRSLVGARVENVNLYPSGAYGLKFSRSKQRMMIDARGWVFLTEARYEGVEPDGLCQKLKKELPGRTLISVAQIGFDRILKFAFEDRVLVLELFAGGNMILLDAIGTILAVLRKREFKSRIIAPGQRYVLPASVDPTFMGTAEFSNKILASKSEVVSTLAVPLGMGADVAREVCLRSNIDERTKAAGLTTEQIENIHEIFSKMISESDAQTSAFSDAETFAPIKLNGMSSPVERQSLSTCISESYLRFIEAIQQGKDDEIGKLERIAVKQKAQIEAFEKRAYECTRIADALYAHFEEVSSALDEIRESRAKAIPEGFTVKKESTVGTVLDSIEIDLDWKEDININAARYYEEAKKFKAKAEGAKEAMQKAAARSKKKEKRSFGLTSEIKPAWFEKFRWFVTSEGCLVIAGRNAKDNELLVRRHMNPQDVYIHADLPGAPSTVIRGRCTEVSIREACAFAVCFSRAWTLKLASADAFWVTGEQVSTHAPPGEFLAKGSFLITGRKNFVRDNPLRLAIGSITYEGAKRFVCAPEASVPDTPPRIVIAPGETNREAFVKDAAISLDAPSTVIERLVPGGGVEVIERKGVDG